MSETLFPAPLVPTAASRDLLLARTSLLMVTLRCEMALLCGERAAWQPEAVSELVRVAHAAKNLHEAIAALTR